MSDSFGFTILHLIVKQRDAFNMVRSECLTCALTLLAITESALPEATPEPELGES